MSDDCTRIQESLVELAGERGRLDAEDRAHLDACASCAELAAVERGLQRLFDEVLAPEDRDHQAAIIAAVARARRRRRAAALLPVAVSLGLVVVGAALLGGIPGGSLFALLPLWSSQGWMTLLGLAGDWQVVATATARSLPVVMTPAVQAISFALCLCGLAGVVLSVRRWRTQTPWQRGR